MALDFPAAPSNGQIFTPVAGGPSWQWDGTKWVAATTGSVTYAPITDPVFLGNPQAPQPAAGDADASIATTKFVTDAVATSLHDVGRNLIHNSMFNIAQRGAGPWNATGYTADRWMLNFGGGDADSASISPMPDAGRLAIGDEAARFYWANTWTGTGSTGAYSIAQQAIEDVRRLAGKTVTLSFYANSSAGQKMGASFDQFFGGGGGSATVQGVGQSVTLGTNWQRFSLTFVLPVISGVKTLGTNGNDCTFLNLWFSSGATNNARAGNIGVQSTGTVTIWGVQLEIGPTATPLEKLDASLQLQQCQRFYAIGVWLVSGYNVAGSGTTAAALSLPVQMRAVPTTITMAPVTMSNCSAQGSLALSAYQIQFYVTTTATGQVQGSGNFTASADF